MSEKEKKAEQKTLWDELEETKTGGFFRPEQGVIYQVTFLTDIPEKREFEYEDKKLTSYDFPIKIAGEQLTWSITSKRLMQTLKAIRDMKGSLEGVTLNVTKKGSGMQTVYHVFA